MKRPLLLVLIIVASKLAIAQHMTNGIYSFGRMPAERDGGVALAAYNSWKSNYVEFCSQNGDYRVRFDNPSQTVSEGIAYGMLLAAYAKDQVLFDGLTNYYNRFKNADGVMDWKIDGCFAVSSDCTGPCTGGAADAEFDYAHALIVADAQWGSSGSIDYAALARNMISIIKTTEIAPSLTPRPGPNWGGDDITNPSYYSPAYFRIWGQFTNDEAYWNAVADKCYDILSNAKTNLNAAYSIVPDWCTSDGTFSPTASGYFSGGQRYHYDAARTPWRIATDYLWFGTNTASQYTDQCNQFVDSKGGLSSIVDGYFMDGSAYGSFNSATFSGAFAVAHMQGSQTRADEAYTYLANKTPNGYFNTTLYTLYLFTMTGNFYNPLVNTPVECIRVDLPGQIQAEAYCAMSGIQVETTEDSGGGSNIGYVDIGDWLEYEVQVNTSGSYDVAFRVSALEGAKSFDLLVDGTISQTVQFNATGGWQNWATINTTLNLSPGDHTIRINATSDGFNINFIDFTQDVCPNPAVSSIELTPNTAQVSVGQSIQLNAVGKNQCGETVPVSLNWSNNAPNGLYTGNVVGMDVVTVSGEGFIATAAINVVDSPISAPGLIQAENFDSVDGDIQIENSGDVDNSQSVGYFDAGEKLRYNVNVPVGFNALISIRVASNAGGDVILGTNLGDVITLQIPATGGWTTYQTFQASLNLPSINEFTISTNTGGVNINWFDIQVNDCPNPVLSSIVVSPSSATVFPGSTVQFLATGVDDCDVPTVLDAVWSGNAPNGLYTASNSEGTDLVTVSAGGITETINITVAKPSRQQNFVVNSYGRLQVGGNQIFGKNGEVVGLAGNSLFWSGSAPQWYTEETIDWLVADWNTQVIRAAMSVHPRNDQGPWNGDDYKQNPQYQMELITTVIDAAIENDIYVIVDFHEHYAEEFIPEAVQFFSDISRMYGEYDNIIYEIYNEPINQSWQVIKDYSIPVIAAIRANDPDNLIVVGTGFYSQEVNEPEADPINDPNVAYTLHGYATENHGSLRRSYSVPIVGTEWGMNVDENGGGETGAWVDYWKTNQGGIINCQWAVNNKQTETDQNGNTVTSLDRNWSILNENVTKAAGWTNSELSQSGRIQKDIILNWISQRPVPITVCQNEALASIAITASATLVNPNQVVNLTAVGTSTCGNVWSVNAMWSANAPGGVFQSSDIGDYIVTVTDGSISQSITITVSDDQPAANMLINGDFSNGDMGWTGFVNSTTANATYLIASGQLNAAISNGGTANWHVQFYQGGLLIESGKSYTLSFDARTSQSRTIEARVEKNGDPWTGFFNELPVLTTAMQNFSYTFTMSEPTEIDGRVSFNLGNGSGDVFIDNVVLSEETISGGNRAPIANAGIDISVATGTTQVGLDGSASSDEDGDALTYDWIQTAGPALTILDANTATPTVSGLADMNTYSFQLTVNDGELSSSSSVSVTVGATNQDFTIRVEAEDYNTMSGIQTETTQDVGGGLNVGYLDNGDFMTYGVNVPVNNGGKVQFRVAADGSETKSFTFSVNGNATNVSFQATAGWQNWITVTADMVIPSGKNTYTITATSDGFNINWFELTNENTDDGESDCVPWQDNTNYPVGTVVSFEGNNYTSNNDWNGTAGNPRDAVWGWDAGGDCSVSNRFITDDRGTVGVLEIQLSDLVIYPSPATSNLTISGLEEGDYSISVYSLSGQLVKHVVIDAGYGPGKIDIQSLEQGIYLLKVKGVDAKKTLKFIKK